MEKAETYRKVRKWYSNNKAYERLKDIRYGHRKLIIICGLTGKGKS